MKNNLLKLLFRCLVKEKVPIKVYTVDIKVFIIIIIIIIITYLFTVDKKMFYIALNKRSLLKSTKNGKIVYLYKSVNITVLYIDFLLKSDNYHVVNLNKTYLVNIRFA